jgi:hypothetical protein
MSNINKRLEQLLKETTPETLAQEGFKTFVPETPIDTGAARKSTKVTGAVIHADYAYATRLNNGRSRQSPKGMADPTIKAVQEYIKKV